jgi:GT2 family glycosyltransferase
MMSLRVGFSHLSRIEDQFGDLLRYAATEIAYTRKRPPVTIIIPVHNRLDLTRPCLESVFETDIGAVRFELIVVDDCSTDGAAEYLRSLGPRVRIFTNKTRRCFSQNINLAAPLAHGEYLCLLNNDTLVTPGWLTRLLAAARKDSTLGVIGNRHVTPGSGVLNHAGMVFDANRNPIHLHLGQPADFPPALVSREFQSVTGACWLVPKALFLELGGFDPAFKNSYEDVDFCLRVRAHGRKVFYAAESVVYHYRAQSPGRTDNETSNAARFHAKWDANIVSDRWHGIPVDVTRVTDLHPRTQGAQRE